MMWSVAGLRVLLGLCVVQSNAGGNACSCKMTL
jgi:hypothetical protein